MLTVDREPFVGQMHPTIILLSVHKSASTFLAHEFADAVMEAFTGMKHIPLHEKLAHGIPLEDLAAPPTGAILSRVYPPHYDMILEDPPPAEGRFADKKVILLRRDPRDVAVSLYYSWAYSHRPPIGDTDHFESRRQELLAMDITAGIGEALPVATRQFLATIEFLQRQPATLLTTYETLVGDFPEWMRQVAAHLAWTEGETALVNRGLEASVQAPEAEDPREHKRRVTPGNWREVFDDELRERFEERIGPELAAAGYTW
jgi:hypothetical protein